jgi:SOS response regulatory protein OraA/RecX
VIDDVLVERGAEGGAGDADRRAAVALVERRRAALAREPDEFRRRQKAYALLARNGFDPETCREVATLVAQGKPEE